MATYRSRAELAGDGAPYLRSTLTLNKPAGTVDNDIVFAVIAIAYGTLGLSMVSEPAGWTKYQELYISNGSGWLYIWVYYKVASGEPSSWDWTLNNQVAFFNCQTISLSSINTSAPIDSISYNENGATGGSPLALGTNCVVNGVNNTMVTFGISSSPAGGPSNISQDVGSETFESEGLPSTHIGISMNLFDMGSSSSQAMTSTSTHSGTAGFKVLQFALEPGQINASVSAPAANATATRAAPQALNGVAAVPARATARGVVPPVITGSQTIPVVPALASARHPAPTPHSSRIAIGLLPEFPASLELVEDP